MKALGEFFQRLSPKVAGFGFLAMALSTAFLLGAATVKLRDRPAQIDGNTNEIIRLDSVQTVTLAELRTHVAQGVVENQRMNCVLDALWQYVSDPDKIPINPNRCPGEDE